MKYLFQKPSRSELYQIGNRNGTDRNIEMADGDEPKRIVGERAPGAVTCHDHVSALLFVACTGVGNQDLSVLAAVHFCCCCFIIGAERRTAAPR